MSSFNRVRIGDLVKLKVPPFSFGVVVDETDGFGYYNHQLIAVMWNDMQNLACQSRVLQESALKIRGALRSEWVKDLPSSEASRILSFVENNTTRITLEYEGTGAFLGTGDYAELFDKSAKAHERNYAVTCVGNIGIIDTHRESFPVVRVMSTTQ